MSALPPLSFVMPVLNEEHYVEAAIDSIREQSGLGDYEVIVVAGRSTDATDEVLDRLAAADARLRVLPNPDNAIPIALNIAFREARHDVVIRVDAHSVLPSDYAARMVPELDRPDVVNAGGVMRARGEGPVQSAAAWAYNSRLGLGGGVFHVGGEAGPAESAYLGVFRRDAVLAVGGYDERLSRGEDWELNLRLREAGGVVWFTPDVEVEYRPRASFAALATQFHASGRWRGQLMRADLRSTPLRHFLPVLFVGALAVSAVLLLVGLAIGSPFTVALGLVVPVLYAAVVLIAALTAPGLAWSARAAVPPVLGTMHLSWALGAVLGLAIPSSGVNAFAGR